MSTDTINKRLKIISDLQSEINKAKAALDEKLEDDPAYQTLQEETAKVREQTKEKKDKIMTRQSVKVIDDEVRNLKKELKENQEILAVELADYYKESGELVFKDDEGNFKRIIFSAKLVSA